jgi:hypothetical protein
MQSSTHIGRRRRRRGDERLALSNGSLYSLAFTRDEEGEGGGESTHLVYQEPWLQDHVALWQDVKDGHTEVVWRFGRSGIAIGADVFVASYRFGLASGR